jgi:membrane associated rhomboid family serine protease
MRCGTFVGERLEVMTTHDTDNYSVLLQTDKPEHVSTIQHALADARIPFRHGLLATRPPSVVFSVPDDHLEQAREVVAAFLDTPARFPWRQFQIVGSVIGVHFAIVVWMIWTGSTGFRLLRQGGLLKGGTLDEPWRLFTSLFLHLDPGHVFWNGASMMVFAVPLLTDLRLARTSMIYFAAGFGGGLTALKFATPGTVIIGSSGAVAGLFGAWLVMALRRNQQAEWPRRAHIRTVGVAMLVLPSLLSPMTSTGQSVSVSSHMGGLATGMLIGIIISSGLLRRGDRRLQDFSVYEEHR